MNAAWLALGGLSLFVLAYRKYGVYLDREVFCGDADMETPAHTAADGVDFVATPKHILFGHHFTSVAGAAPIVGPAIAVIWGWLPAFIWVVAGTVFIGAVHDYGCLVVSAKNGARSIGDLTAAILTRRSRLLYLSLVLFLAWIVLAVFAYVIARLFVDYPATVLPINFEVICAPLIGYWAYKKKGDILIPSVIVLGSLCGAIWVGTKYPISLPSIAGADPVNVWIALLLGYAFIASVLPVWLLLQPRDLINSHKLFLGLGLMYIGLFIVNPPMAAPALNLSVSDGPPWFPFLFITIACGAISGFHGVVRSGTTSKQLDLLKDARPIGFGGMLGEGTLALMSVFACTAGFASREAWSSHYATWSHAQGLGPKIGAFIEGGAYFLSNGAGFEADFARSCIAVMVISFAATTLDTATRIQRMIISELGEAYGISALKNRFVASAAAAGSPLLLVYGGNWKALWPIFGATNQMLGGLSLLVLSVYLFLKKKPYGFVLAPMLFLTCMTSGSMVIGFFGFLKTGNILLAVISVLLLGLSLAMLWEGLSVYRRFRRDGASALALN
jgi:carbon starvation protein